MVLYIGLGALVFLIAFVVMSELFDRATAQAREQGYLAGWNDHEYIMSYNAADDSSEDHEFIDYEWEEVL